jgi:hypothetical protein
VEISLAVGDFTDCLLLAHLRHTGLQMACLYPPKRKFETLPESFTEGSKNVRHLPRYLSIQRDPEFFSAYHH